MSGSIAIRGLTLDSAATSVVDTSALTLTGTLRVEAGTFDMAPDARINGGTIDVTRGWMTVEDGTINRSTILDPNGHIAFSDATLLSMTFRGPMDLTGTGSSVNLEGKETFSGADGTGRGTLNVLGNNSSLNFPKSAGLSFVLVNIGLPGSAAAIELGSNNNPNPATLTLGRHTTINQIGGNVAIYTAIEGGTLVNAGTILAGGDDGYFTIGGDDIAFSNLGTFSLSEGGTADFYTTTFRNSGTILVGINAGLAIHWNAGVNGGSFANTGLISAAFGSTISLGQNAWTNVGTLETQGTMLLAGNLINDGLLLGTMQFLGGVTNMGTIVTSNAVFQAELFGTGTVALSGGTAQFDQGAGHGFLTFSTQTYDTGTLALENPLSYLSTIENFGSQDQIHLLSTPATSETFASGTLDVFNGSSLVAGIAMSGDYASSNFTLASDNRNGTVINYHS